MFSNTSNTASHLDSSVGLSTELAVVPTESSASHNGETYARRTEANKCDYKGALEFSFANDYAQSEAFLSFERGGENEAKQYFRSWDKESQVGYVNPDQDPG